MTVDESLSYKPAPHVLSQQLEDEIVLLNMEAEHYYSLDDVGSRVWQLLSEHDTLDAVVRQMLLEFAADEATLRTDVVTLVAQLQEAGLVVPQA